MNTAFDAMAQNNEWLLRFTIYSQGMNYLHDKALKSKLSYSWDCSVGLRSWAWLQRSCCRRRRSSWPQVNRAAPPEPVSPPPRPRPSHCPSPFRSRLRRAWTCSSLSWSSRVTPSVLSFSRSSSYLRLLRVRPVSCKLRVSWRIYLTAQRRAASPSPRRYRDTPLCDTEDSA